MATNRFEGVLQTNAERNTAYYHGFYGSQLENLIIVGGLNDGTDTDLTDNYSSSTDCVYTATDEMVVYKVVLVLESGSFTGSAAVDMGLFLAGVAALTNGFTFKLTDSAGTTISDFGTTQIKTLDDFAGAGFDVFRYSYTVDATAGDNSDAVIATYDFVKNFGIPLRVKNGEKLGFAIHADLSGLTLGYGNVFGRIIYNN